MIKINYSQELNQYIEKVRFEQYRYLSILRYLSLQENTNKQIIEEYYQKAFEAILTFYLLKDEIIEQTCPNELKGHDFKYTMNLDEGFIKYE